SVGELIAVVELVESILVGILERERIRRVDRRDGRILVPGVGKIDQTRLLDGSQELSDPVGVFRVSCTERTARQQECHARQSDKTHGSPPSLKGLRSYARSGSRKMPPCGAST